MITKRASGLLLHITSLPSAHGIGDLGPEAYRFADFLAASKQTYWQILPLTPIEEGLGNSPYSSASAFAGNTLLISLEVLASEDILSAEDLKHAPPFPAGKVDYRKVRAFKEPLLEKAYQNFFNEASTTDRQGYEVFCEENKDWLDDFALFFTLNLNFNYQPWNEWPEDIRNRTVAGLTKYNSLLEKEIQKEKFLQYLFARQWFALKKYCAAAGIHFIGDLPIYVHFQSADVWANPEVFKLDKHKKPYVVAGVPPDYFSETGQLWGNPVYDWDYLKKTGYAWWVKRLGHNIHLFDMVRLDHFLGFVAFWEVDAREKTALHGQWVKAPADDFFQTLLRHYPHLPIIAEDLGIVTAEVTQCMQRFNFPGMKVLLFAFGDNTDTNPYAPHNHIENCLVYTGTHDNNTVKGWFTKEADKHTRQGLEKYSGLELNGDNISWEFVRMAMQSVAKLIIIPIQDLIGLDDTARMNTPGTVGQNWAWRLEPGLLTKTLSSETASVTHLFGRE
ncbi:4-alpha-glucanotransferase [Rhodocytophaga rosea]|uniref:4-alpha-glucanotransferase n=1 Tax=Rhodocytophaga rosea TaxID=2704465 RepID=A0A6C0GNL4_9BACT|nr:4-alpha-glucanotransferase [Rhodocytophaga rosea]QHT69527.1 4-alpha-glucanotransferase [Rhodocytophaga rosea]